MKYWTIFLRLLMNKNSLVIHIDYHAKKKKKKKKRYIPRSERKPFIELCERSKFSNIINLESRPSKET